MTNQNSLDAYNALSASGILARTQLEAWQLLRTHGPITVQELTRVCEGGLAKLKSLSARVSELQSLGLAKPAENRTCRVTGFRAAAFVATIPTGVMQGKPKRREFWVAAKDGEPIHVDHARWPGEPGPGWEFIKVREVIFKK